MRKILLILLFIPFILKGVDKVEPQSVKFNQYIIVKDSATAGYLLLPRKSSYPSNPGRDKIINYNGTLQRYNGSTWLPLIGYTAENLANKGIANGYASLDAYGKLPTSQMYSAVISHPYVCSSMACMLALDADTGDICVRTDSALNFVLQQTPASVYNNWIQLSTAVGVISVNGQTGTIVLDAEDVGAIATEIDPVWVSDSSDYYKKVDIIGLILHKVNDTTQINGHALTGRVIISATDITTGTLPHAQLPALDSADIPNNGANTTGTSGGLKDAYIDWTSNTGGNMILNKPNVVLQGDSTSLYYSHHAVDSLLKTKQNKSDTTTYDATKNDVAIERNAKNDSISDLRNLIDTKVNLIDSNIIYTTPHYVDSLINSNVEQTYIYAGTSPDGYILRSSNHGLTWSNLGSAGKGQPLAFCQVSNGDLLYTTDQGYVVNHTKGTSVKVSNYAIKCIYINNNILSDLSVGDVHGDIYNSVNLGNDFTLFSSNGGYAVNSIIITELGVLYAFTVNGIYINSNNQLIQAGNFTSALQIPNTDTIYALTYGGNVFRSINVGTSWTDLGNKNAQKPLIKGNGSRIIYLNSGTDIYYTDDGFTTTHMALETEQSKACGTSISNTVIIGGKNSGADFFFISNDNGLTYPTSSTFAGQDSINCIIAVTGSTYVQPGDLSIYETKVQHNADTTLQRAWMNGLESRKLNLVDTNHFINENDTNATSKLIETHTALMSDSVGKSGNEGGIIMTWLKTFILNRLGIANYQNDTIHKVLTRNKFNQLIKDSLTIDSLGCAYTYNDGETGIALINNAPTATAIKNIGRSINTDTVIIKKGKPLIFRNSTINTNTTGDIRLWTDTDTTKISRWNGTTWVNLLKLNSSGDLTLTGDLKYRYTHEIGSGDSINTTYTLTRNVYQKMTSLSLTPHDTDGIKIQGDSIQIWKHEGDYWMTPVVAGNGANANDRIQIKVFINNVASATSLGRYIIAGNGLPQDYHYYLKDIPKGAWISFHITNLTASRNFTLTDFKVLISKAPEQ